MASKVAVLVTDLIFSTKIFSTAKAVGAEALGARNLDVLATRLADPEVGRLIVDLNSAGVDVIEAIRRAKAQRPDVRVLAFLSHVQVELAQQAREAGADQVMARSAFSAKLPELLNV